MSNNELEVRIKIGEIEFYAKGQTADVEAQRQNFINIILPAASITEAEEGERE